jgi:hypothetical protein
MPSVVVKVTSSIGTSGVGVGGSSVGRGVLVGGSGVTAGRARVGAGVFVDGRIEVGVLVSSDEGEAEHPQVNTKTTPISRIKFLPKRILISPQFASFSLATIKYQIFLKIL